MKSSEELLKRTPLLLEIRFLNAVPGESVKVSLSALANLWREYGGLGLLPDRRVRMRHGLRLNLTGISSHKDSDEIIQKRIQAWEKTIMLAATGVSPDQDTTGSQEPLQGP